MLAAFEIIIEIDYTLLATIKSTGGSHELLSNRLSAGCTNTGLTITSWLKWGIL